MQFRRDPLGFLARVAKDHGDVVHFQLGAKHGYFVNHPDAIRDVLVTHNAKFHKGPALKSADVMLGQGLLTSEDPFHATQRKLIGPAFHPARVAAYGADMVRYADLTRRSWTDGQTFDVHEQMMRLTLRAVAKTLLDAELEEEVERIGHDVSVSVEMFERALQPWHRLLDRLPLPSNFRFRKARARIVETVDGMIAARRADSNGHGGAASSAPRDRGDFLSILLSARDESCGGAMDDRQARAEAITIFLAGHETTANALTFTWYCLARAPQAEAALHHELDQTLNGRLPTIDDLPNLPYTRMVVSEAMRLYPPAWGLGRTSLAAVPVGGYEILPGSLVLLSQWVTHRDPRFWPDPLTFDPMRWAPAARDARPKHAYFPFGGGARSCIGEAFAWMELVLMTATIAQQWRMEYLGKGEPALQPTITLRPKHGMPVRVIRRG